LKRDIIEKLEFGCLFKPGTIGEKDAELAEVLMQEAANEIKLLRGAIGPNLERARLQGRSQGIQVAIDVIDKNLVPGTSAIIRRILLESV